MRVRALGVIVVTVGTLVIAGCGVKTTGAGGQGNPVAPSSCVTPKLTKANKTFTITEKDTGKTYCVVAGTSMFVFLHSTPTRVWAPIQASSAALQRRPSGVFSLARGVTGAYYLAARSGRVMLESSRPPCHPAAASKAACGPANSFQVKIQIRGKM